MLPALGQALSPTDYPFQAFSFVFSHGVVKDLTDTGGSTETER